MSDYDWSPYLHEGEKVLWQRTVDRRPSTILEWITRRAAALLLAVFLAFGGTWAFFNLLCRLNGFLCDVDPQRVWAVLGLSALAWSVLLLFSQNVRTASAYALTTNRVMQLHKIEKPRTFFAMKLENGITIKRSLRGFLIFKRSIGLSAIVLPTKRPEVDRVEKTARKALRANTAQD